MSPRVILYTSRAWKPTKQGGCIRCSASAVWLRIVKKVNVGKRNTVEISGFCEKHAEKAGKKA
jgi:hypothetical protein